MPQPKKGPRLGSNPSHQKLLLSTLAAQLFTHEAINTTEAKAIADPPDREVLKDIPDRDVVARLFHKIGPRFTDRSGGYTRILKLGPRKGDAAPMARIELVEREGI